MDERFAPDHWLKWTPSASCMFNKESLLQQHQQTVIFGVLLIFFYDFAELNDTIVDGIHRPVVYGIGVNVKTGEVFPSSFSHKGPAEQLRSTRTFTGGKMVDIYDSSRGLVKIGPCKWSSNLDVAFWLSQKDDTILKYLSTSPMAEPPHFVQHMKSTIQFFLEHSDCDSLFPGGQPQLYHRAETGSWERVDQP
ncbi:Protein N-terminal asparagine amidohydrolase [Takifugu flavidus]|uniref:Protein N-terminal asparagine amidohydrolase n=1 Tax=Takifugu flavidus TaxID=433684 RepID=A0A5C6MTL3_9TELE|nr:Protein N-terminal asparagine amidohydrolase [Takifugu flavidus]